MKEAARNFTVAYFAMVMATGIVSVASHLLGYEQVAIALFWLNVVAYLVLWVLTIAKAVSVPRTFFGDMIDHQRGPGYFTSVAASCILGTQFILIAHEIRVAIALWVVGMVLWLVVTYTIFTGFTVKEEKPTLDRGITGAWLLAVVATQSVAVLSALIAQHWPQPFRLEANFLALCMWLWGGMLYIWMISLIFYRYTFFRFHPSDLTPPYWINMGAMAISSLAGALLIISAPDAPFLQSLLPFLKGFTIFYWVTGTWWVPMLLLLGVWRYVYKGFPLTYDPLYWGAVFPLGMYTAATYRMTEAMPLAFLRPVPRYFIWIAYAAWLATFAGLARSIVSGSRGTAGVASGSQS
jgi:tellurite resistance protein TehA-like permease